MITVFSICTAEHYGLAADVAYDLLHLSGHKLNIIDAQLTTGSFLTPEFYDIQKFKIETLVHMMNGHPDGHHIVYLDGDIILKKDIIAPMLECIGECDVAFQRDRDSYCAGMFIVKNNEKTRAFFADILHRLDTLRDEYLLTTADQAIINDVLNHGNPGINVCFLDSRFTTYGNIDTESSLWEGQEFELDESTVAFHANFTIGLPRKIELMNYVRGI